MKHSDRTARYGGIGLVAALLATGCSSTIIEDDDDGGGGLGGAATTSANGSTAGNGSTSTTKTSSSPSSSSTGTAACEGFEDVTTGEGMAVLRVTNKTGQPIYLPVSCGTPSFGVLTSVGGIFPGDRSCLQTCQELQTSGHLDCGACAPESRRIEPDASFDLVWDGLGLLSTTMPLACFENPNEGDACQKLVAAPVNQIYSAQVRVFSSCGDDVVGCACTPDGRCSGAASGQESFPRAPSAGEFMFGVSSFREISFGPCTFGCPD